MDYHTQMSELTIVTPRSWQDLADADQFYPDDLPDDWRLGYFANTFSAILLPYTLWSGADAATQAQWRDDVTPRFRFVATTGRGADAAESTPMQGLEQTLGPQLRAWLAPNLLPATEAAATPAAQAQGSAWFACWPPGIGHAASNASSSDEEAVPPYAVIAPPALHRDLRAARSWIDGLLERHGQPPAVIVLARPFSHHLEAWYRLVELLDLQQGGA